MKKLKLDDFAKANVTIEKKAMKTVQGGDAAAEPKSKTINSVVVEFM
jgi:hypothetical protein